MAVHRRLASVGGPEEPDLLAGRNVIFGIWRDETAAAVVDWLDWHRRFLGATGALIDAGTSGSKADALEKVLVRSDSGLEIVLVVGEAADVSSVDAMRRRYLGQARAVAFLGIADLMLQDRAGTPFDRAVGLRRGVLPLEGVEIYPFRLRRGKPAAHGDHVAVDGTATGGRLSGWCIRPEQCPTDAVWHVNGVANMPLAQVQPGRFRRAMGVARPGVPIGAYARKSDLVESAELVEMMTGAFGRRPPIAQPGRRALARAAEERRAVTIVSTMKNEGPFILDWIAHHRAIGVTRFLIYTNDCSDGTDRLLDLLSDAGVVRRDNPYRTQTGGPQHAAFRAAAHEAVVREADWLLALDVDEYLNIRIGNGQLSDLLATVPGAGAISIPWRLFGNSDRHGFVDAPVASQFPLAAPEYAPRPWQAWAFKTLFRNDGTFGGLGVHRPKALNEDRAHTLRWVDGTGRPFPRQLWRNGWRMTPQCWGYDLAAINHYAVRSAESFLVKRERGRVNHVSQDQGVNYWFRMNQNVVEDRSIRRLDWLVSAERARLGALPEVAEAHEAAVAWHRDRIRSLMAEPDYATLFEQISGARLEKLSRLTPNFGSGVFYRGPEVIPDPIVARDPGQRFYFNVE